MRGALPPPARTYLSPWASRDHSTQDLVTTAAAAATTVAAATAAATTAAAVTAATTTAATATIFTWTGFIHGHSTTLKISTVQCGNGSFAAIAHFHEAEAT